MSGSISEVVAAVTPPKDAEGKSVSISMTPDHCVSFFTLGVEFRDENDDKLLDALVEISPGTLQSVIKYCYDKAVTAAEDDGETPTIPNPADPEGPEIANPDYPVKPDAQQMWTAAQNQLNNALADETAVAQPTLVGKLAKVADIIVNLLVSGAANPGGAYPQRWGKTMLKRAYYAKAAQNG